MLLRTMSSQVLSISKDGNSTASPGNLLQYFTRLTVKRSFVLRWNGISYISFCSHCFLSVYWIPLRRVWLWLFCLLSRHLCTLIRSEPSFCRLDSPSPLSVSLYDRCISPFIIFWGLSSLQYAHVSCTGELRAGSSIKTELTSAEQKRFTSLDLLAMFSLVQPRELLAFVAVRVHCWLKISLVCTRTHRSFSAELCM